MEERSARTVETGATIGEAARRPEAIFLFSTPVLRNVTHFVSGRFDLFRRIYWCRSAGGSSGMRR
jgi:hypothetical protein